MGDTTPIPAPRRGLLGSANLTVLVKLEAELLLVVSAGVR